MNSKINNVSQKEQNINKNINNKGTKIERTNTKISKLHHKTVVDSLSARIHIGIIGPSKCGKSSLLKAFIFKTFNPSFKEDSFLNIHKLILTIDMKPIEVIITEIAINKETTNEKIAGQLTNTMDVIFLCHEMTEKDTSFNEEDIKKMIAYINNITNKKSILLYLVGCKLDQKFESLGNDTTNIYEKIPPYKLTTYGQRIKTFVDGNKIKKFFATSALLNFNISELFEHAIISAAYIKYKIFHELKKNSNENDNKNIDDNKGNNIFDEIEDKSDKLLDEEEFIQRCNIF